MPSISVQKQAGPLKNSETFTPEDGATLVQQAITKSPKINTLKTIAKNNPLPKIPKNNNFEVNTSLHVKLNPAL